MGGTGVSAGGVRPRLDSLTGLRFAAAFVVFGFHFLVGFYSTTPIRVMTHVLVQGPVGVSFFFVLSGFVLTWSHRHGDTSKAFYQRRMARIGPLHVLTWGLMGVLLIGFSEWPGVKAAVASLGLLVPWIPKYAYHPPMNGPSWSLGCELMFYALFPFIFVRIWRLSASARRVAIAGTVVLVFLFAAAAAPAAPDTLSTWALYFFPPVRLVEFVLGMLLALEVADGRLPRISLVGASLFALGVYIADSWAPAPVQSVALTLIPFSVLIVAAAQADVSGARSWWRSKVMVRLGTWSFAIYMIHAFVLLFLAHYVTATLGDTATVALGLGALGATVALAALLYRFVEHPLEARLRPRALPEAATRSSESPGRRRRARVRVGLVRNPLALLGALTVMAAGGIGVAAALPGSHPTTVAASAKSPVRQQARTTNRASAAQDAKGPDTSNASPAFSASGATNSSSQSSSQHASSWPSAGQALSAQVEWYDDYASGVVASIAADDSACQTTAGQTGGVGETGLTDQTGVAGQPAVNGPTGVAGQPAVTGRTGAAVPSPGADASSREEACQKMLSETDGAVSGQRVSNAEAESDWQSYLNDEMWVARISMTSTQEPNPVLTKEAAADEQDAQSKLSAMRSVLGVSGP